MSFLLDADWVINALANIPRATTPLLQLASQRIAISQVTVAEIYEGAFRSSNPEAMLAIYRGFLAPFQRLTVTDAIAERFAEVRSLLRRRGQLISDFDIMLAATALHYDLTVLTFNIKDFQRIPDLKFYRPN